MSHPPALKRIAPFVLAALVAGVTTTIAWNRNNSSVSGIVVDTIALAPVPDALVVIRSRDGSERRAVASDSNGRFVFGGMQPGDYTLTASKNGFSTTLPSGSVRITLGHSQWIQSLLLKIEPQARVSGNVSGPNGRAVYDVAVRALVQIWTAGRLQWALGPLTKTNERGNYFFDSLRPGTYTFAIMPRLDPEQAILEATTRFQQSQTLDLDRLGRPKLGFDLHRLDRQIPRSAIVSGLYEAGGSAYPPVFYPGVQELGLSKAIELAPGADLSALDFNLVPTQVLDIRGRVEGPHTAFEKLRVSLLPSGARSLGIGAEISSVRIADDGGFLIEGVPQGHYDLSVSGHHGQIVVDTTLPTGSGQQGNRATYTTISSFPLGAYVSLRSAEGPVGYSWNGSVFLDKTSSQYPLRLALVAAGVVRGIVRCECGRWPRSLGLRLDPADGDPSRVVQDIVVSPSGVFEFTNVSPGQYHVRLVSSEQGYRKALLLSNGLRLGGGPIDVNSATTTEVELRIVDRPTRVLGTARSTKATTSTPAAVLVFPQEQEAWDNIGFNPDNVSLTRVNGDGTFEISGLTPGVYLAVALSDAALPLSRTRFSELAPFSTLVALAPGVPVEVSLRVVRD